MLLLMSGTTETHPLLNRLLEIVGQRPLQTAEFAGLLFMLDRYRAEMLSFMRDYDVLLCPPCARPAMEHGTTFEGENFLFFTYTMAFNLTGWPGAVVRVATSPEGLPLGVQAVARPWREDVALAVVSHLEASLGGWQRAADDSR